ncbi:MAG: flagellar filament capping protein FliD [Defluviitaleaceae bacterium]|nr:flagellar filament capping protein FliD [Defluviitaleaceae bacterium]
MAVFTNVNRVTGFSGMDTNQMIREIMMAQSQRLHNLQRSAQFQVWRQEAYRGVSNSLNTFRTRFLDVATGPDAESIRMRSVMDSRVANVVSGNLQGLTVSANPNASPGSFNFQLVSRANNHRFISDRRDVAITGSNPLNIANLQDGDRFNINLNGAGGDASFTIGAGNTISTEINGTTISRTFTDEASFANALNELLGERFGNIPAAQLPPGNPGPLQRVQSSLNGGRLQIDTNGAGNTATISQVTIPGLRPVSWEPMLPDSFLTNWVNGELVSFNIGGGGGLPNVTINVSAPVGTGALDNDGRRAAFAQAFNQAAQAAGRSDVAMTMGGAGNQEFRFVFANSNYDISIQSTTHASLFHQSSPAGVTAQRNLSLGVLGGFENNDQNTFNINNTIGNILGSGFFTSPGTPPTRDITINGTTITLNEDMTITQMMSAVNGSGAGVNMAFNSLTSSFSLTSNNGGGNGSIVGGAGFQDFLNATGLYQNEETGGNAMVSINGVLVEAQGNTFTYNGVTFNFANVLDSDVPSGGIVVEVSQNIERSQQIIRNFINEYNALVRELNGLRTTARPISATGQPFHPLLEHERRAMTDSEIRMWEEQAKIGTLHRSRELQAILGEMRRVITGIVEDPNGGPNSSIFSFGITTNVDGTLRIENPEDFEALLQSSDPEALFRTFSTLGDNLNYAFQGRIGEEGRRVPGFFQRLEQVAGRENAGVLNRNTNLQRRVDEYQIRIDRLTQQLTRRETALFARFNRMERVVMQSNAQMEFLLSMMMG